MSMKAITLTITNLLDKTLTRKSLYVYCHVVCNFVENSVNVDVVINRVLTVVASGLV